MHNMQSVINELFEKTAGETNALETAIEERNQKWEITDQKMNIFMSLKHNLKQMFQVQQGYSRPH